MRTAVYSGTRNLYPDMVTAVKSLLHHDGADRVVLLIEDDEFPYTLPDCCESMNMRDQEWFWPHGPNYCSQWTYMVLMRAALAKIFPEEDKVLSLDVDTIVDGDISGLWELPLDQYYLAAAEEPNTPKAEHYVQMGVVLFNLKKMREDRMDSRLIHAINTRKFDFVEQGTPRAGRVPPLRGPPYQHKASITSTGTQSPRTIRGYIIMRRSPTGTRCRWCKNTGIWNSGSDRRQKGAFFYAAIAQARTAFARCQRVRFTPRGFTYSSL